MSSKQTINLELARPYASPIRLLSIVATILLVMGLLGVGFFAPPELTALGVAAIGLGVPLFVLLWYRPEFGLLGLIFLTSSFVPADMFDIRLPIGGGLDLRDLVLIGMFALLFLRELANKTIAIPWWKVSGPLILFLSLAVFSAFYGVVFQHVESNWALSDLRILSCYILFFMVIWSIKRLDQLHLLLFGLFVIADLTTLVVVLQQFAGANNPLLESMMTTQDWHIYQEAGGVRVIPAGQILMHFQWFIALGLLIFARLTRLQKAVLVFQVLFIGIGHILTYMRSQWAAMLLGLCLVGLVIVSRNRSLLPKYVTLGFAFIFIAALLWGASGLSSLINNPVLEGLSNRFLSILTVSDTLETKSLQWRQFENGEALKSILRHPVLGVGLGGRYRNITTLQGETQGLWTRGSLAAGYISRFTRYVHNSYLSIAVKMGLPGLGALLWFLIAFLLSSWKSYRALPDSELRGIVLGVLVSFIGVLPWFYFHAHLIKAESTPAISFMAGLVAVCISLQHSENL